MRAFVMTERGGGKKRHDSYPSPLPSITVDIEL